MASFRRFILLFCLTASLGAQDLGSALKKMDAELRWDPLSRTGTLVSGSHRLVFQTAPAGTEDVVVLDGRDLYRLPVPYLEAGELRFPEAFVSGARSVFDRARENERSAYRIAAVVVDPGHGGRDSGAVGDHVIDGKRLRIAEKDVVLAVSKELHRLLAEAYPDKRILLTRTGDTYPSLDDRVALAHSVPLASNEAVVFISVHANASFNKNARGYEVWYLSPEYRRTVIDEKKFTDSSDVLPILNAMLEEEYTTESIMMARSIMNRFDQAVGVYGPSRGIKAEEWFVVRNARMPSVLVELGFVTNAEDARLMADEAYLRKLSDALYKGTVDFITTFERSGGFTTVR